MCDYSLHLVASRPAKIGDRLVTTMFPRTITRGFAAVGEHGPKLVIDDGLPDMAVCLLPGTELSFDAPVEYDRVFSFFGRRRSHYAIARFRQINMDDPHQHHDAVEFPDGTIVLITRLRPGQRATVLQLPVTKQERDQKIGNPTCQKENEQTVHV